MSKNLNSKLIVVILAAGKGLRMLSDLPKVLHPIAKQPMLGHILKKAHALNPYKILVIHPQKAASNPIFDFISEFSTKENINNIQLVEQAEQLGTGDAVLKAMEACSDAAEDMRFLILCGDVPLIDIATLNQLIENTPSNALGVVTAHLENPFGMGRIVREDSKIKGIVEEKDATEAQKTIKEINSGLFLVPLAYLRKWLPHLKNNNASKEYYLTDIVSAAVQENIPVIASNPGFVEEVHGINDREQQALLERCYQKKQAQNYLKQGVWIADPNRFDLRGSLSVQTGVCIDVNVVLEGEIVLGKNTSIGPNCILINCKIGEGVQILANSYLENVHIAENCVIGPFARLRPGTHLEAGAKIGNFVEVKNSTIGPQSKVNHLSYIGDTTIGARVNVGAGTITCNYDGVNKHKTIIEDDVNIGSNTQLIAPVRIGKGATIAAGSTVIKDAPSNALTLTQQIHQRIKEGWKRPESENEKT
jgi:bifunctional UDP-N-acetylglucosamine pyrophosphorylase/glucosamine-1-phosphate N-acetyltransferase